MPNNLTSLSVCVVVASLTVAFTASVRGQDDAANAKWTPLSRDMSRAQLFQRYQKQMAAGLQGTKQPFVFPAGFTFAHDALADTNGKTRQGEIFGVDISHYEGSNFPLCSLKRQQVGFIYMKATQGTKYGDPVFDHNWKAMSQCGDQQIPRGAYHFLSSSPPMSGKQQADWFVDYLEQHGQIRDGDLAPAMDLEWDVACKNCPDRWQTNHRTPDQIVRTARDFLDEVEAQLKRKPLIYTNKSFLKAEGITDPALVSKLIGTSKVWIFDLDSHDRAIELPDPSSNLSHVLWQFSFTGKLTGGFSGSFDVSVFKTSDGAFPGMLAGTD